MFLGIPRELEEAAWVFGCTPLPGLLQGGAAAGAARHRRDRDLRLRHLLERGLRRLGADGAQRTLTAYLLTVLSESPLHYRFAGGFMLIVPSVVFIFAVRRYLFAIWGISCK